MQKFFVNSDTCTKCGICIAVCPSYLLYKNSDNLTKFKEEKLHLCIGCGQCMAVCNTKSVFANGLTYEKDFFEFSENKDFVSLLEQRRSVRRFKPKPVSKEELEKILFTVSQAPHGDAHHNVEITVINNREKIMESLPLMSAFYDKLAKWLHNPIMRSIIKKRKGKDTLNTLMNHLLPRIEGGLYKQIDTDYDGITRGSHTLMIFHAHKDSEEHKEDAFILVTYAMLTAHSLGLGATIVGLVPAALNKEPELRKMFGIPDDHDSVISLIMGYPKYKYKRGIKRNLKKINWIT